MDGVNWGVVALVELPETPIPHTGVMLSDVFAA